MVIVSVWTGISPGMTLGLAIAVGAYSGVPSSSSFVFSIRSRHRRKRCRVSLKPWSAWCKLSGATGNAAEADRYRKELAAGETAQKEAKK